MYFFCLKLLSFVNLQVAIFHHIWKEFDLSFFLSSFVFSFFTSFFFLSYIIFSLLLPSFLPCFLPPSLPSLFYFHPFLPQSLSSFSGVPITEYYTTWCFTTGHWSSLHFFTVKKKNRSWVVSTDFCVNSLFFSAAFSYLLLSLSREIFSDILFFSYRNLIFFFLTIFISLLVVLICSFIMSI